MNYIKKIEHGRYDLWKHDSKSKDEAFCTKYRVEVVNLNEDMLGGEAEEGFLEFTGLDQVEIDERVLGKVINKVTLSMQDSADEWLRQIHDTKSSVSIFKDLWKQFRKPSRDNLINNTSRTCTVVNKLINEHSGHKLCECLQLPLEKFCKTPLDKLDEYIDDATHKFGIDKKNIATFRRVVIALRTWANSEVVAVQPADEIAPNITAGSTATNTHDRSSTDSISESGDVIELSNYSKHQERTPEEIETQCLGERSSSTTAATSTRTQRDARSKRLLNQGEPSSINDPKRLKPSQHDRHEQEEVRVSQINPYLHTLKLLVPLKCRDMQNVGPILGQCSHNEVVDMVIKLLKLASQNRDVKYFLSTWLTKRPGERSTVGPKRFKLNQDAENMLQSMPQAPASSQMDSNLHTLKMLLRVNSEDIQQVGKPLLLASSHDEVIEMLTKLLTLASMNNVVQEFYCSQLKGRLDN